jgi:hypothetical protein
LRNWLNYVCSNGPILAKVAGLSQANQWQGQADDVLSMTEMLFFTPVPFENLIYVDSFVVSIASR